jgi:preprotein translocase subunit SecA
MTALQPITSVLHVLWPRTEDPSPRDQVTALSVREEADLLAQLSDQQLREQADALRIPQRKRANRDSGKTLKQAFALVCEAARRAIGINYYDVQILAGVALSRGAVAEMQTGEGKTFVAAFPAFYFALLGEGVHVMTVNAYLSNRDCQVLSPLYRVLGMSVGNLRPDDSADAKKAAYASDITYGPSYEFGFDYLRDQAALLSRKKPPLGDSCLRKLRGEKGSDAGGVQRGQAFAIVDEIDSVLIDEATSPLVLSEGSGELAEYSRVYLEAKKTAGQLQAERDYSVDLTAQHIRLTEQGHQKVQANIKGAAPAGLQRPWSAYVEQALRADLLFSNDVDYIVNDGKILLVDQSTGRIFPDRTLRDGLHQAIEAKEGVPITDEHRSLARISRQRYFCRYSNLCGMTGTAEGNEREFWSVYRMPVVRIPLRKPCRREKLPTRFFADQESKWRAIAQSIRRVHQTRQPVLAGARTIESSEALAQRLNAEGLSYQLLNGTQDAAEAEIVAQAGRAGAITVATNMAGRGTDIKLEPGVEATGGLHVVGSEPHESTRVDRQLAGRSARQGDPGSYQLFVAADDRLIRCYAPSIGVRMKSLADGHGEIETDFSEAVAQVQRKAERFHCARRREVVAQDEWLAEVLAELARHD